MLHKYDRLTSFNINRQTSQGVNAFGTGNFNRCAMEMKCLISIAVLF